MPGATARAMALLPRVEALVARIEAIASEYAGLLRALAPDAAKLVPALRRLASTVSEREVDAAVGLIDQLPQPLETVKADVLPLLERLGPDVHATMEIVDDVRNIINGLLGARLFRRRGEEAAEEEHGEDSS